MFNLWQDFFEMLLKWFGFFRHFFFRLFLDIVESKLWDLKKKKYEYCVIKSAVTGKHSVMLQTKTNQPVKSLRSFWSSCCLTARFDSAPHACSPLICLIYTLLPCYAHLSFSMRQPIWMCGIMIGIIHIHQRPQSWCHLAHSKGVVEWSEVPFVCSGTAIQGHI